MNRDHWAHLPLLWAQPWHRLGCWANKLAFPHSRFHTHSHTAWHYWHKQEPQNYLRLYIPRDGPLLPSWLRMLSCQGTAWSWGPNRKSAPAVNQVCTDTLFKFPREVFIRRNVLHRLGSARSVQSLSRVWLFVTPWTTAHQASLSITNSQSIPKPMSIESVMPSNHLILCRQVLLPPSMHQGLFKWVSSSHQVAKVLEFQLQHQSFQWTPRTDLL